MEKFKQKKLLIFLISSLLILGVSIILGVKIGGTNIDFKVIISVLLNKFLGVNTGVEYTGAQEAIIWNLRLPRVLIACIVGAGLAVSGTIVQSVLKNPLASPYTLGISSGSILGVAIVVMFNITIFGGYTGIIFGFATGILTVLAVLTISRLVDRSLSNLSIILMGIIISLFLNGLVTIIAMSSQESLQSIFNFQVGTLSLKSWDEFKLLAPIFIICFLISMLFIKDLDILSFGEEQAKSVGVNTNRSKLILLFVATIIACSGIALTGVIGFIGLVAPHVVRKIFGAKHIYVLPMSAVFGAIFLVIADMVARTIIAPNELSVGAITALIGAPFFALVFFTKRRRT